MLADKSLFYYGPMYHRLLDPPLAEARSTAVDLVMPGSAVLDIGCGTGQLCFELRARKGCRVVGVDQSLRMLAFARRMGVDPELAFVHGDGGDLPQFADQAFDYATVLMVMHEVVMAERIRILQEALRVARRAVVIDSVAPLPRNGGGVGIRLVERVLGYDHHPSFKAFLASGGLHGLLREAGPSVTLETSRIFWHGCREAIVISGAGAAQIRPAAPTMATAT